MNKKRLLYIILTLFTLSSCDIIIDNNDPDNPYEEYSGRMIERVRIKKSNNSTDFIYYEYDRRGRIISIENSYYNTVEEYSYGENQDGDEIINIWSNIGDDRDITLNWDGYADQEISYRQNKNDQTTQYLYSRDMLTDMITEEYNGNGSLFSSESYKFEYDYRNNLRFINRYYEEYDYYIESELEFSSFTDYKNTYNVDILALLELYIEDDFASHIGRTGDRSQYLPAYAHLTIDRNGRQLEKTEYRINYIGDEDYITAIEIESSTGDYQIYQIDYL